MRLPLTTLPETVAVRTALTVEVRGGQLYVFGPPVEQVDDYVRLIAAIEDCARAQQTAVLLEGLEHLFSHGSPVAATALAIWYVGREDWKSIDALFRGRGGQWVCPVVYFMRTVNASFPAGRALQAARCAARCLAAQPISRFGFSENCPFDLLAEILSAEATMPSPS